MTAFPGKLEPAAEFRQDLVAGMTPRVGIVDGAVPSDRIDALASLFSDVLFKSVGVTWPDQLNQGIDLLIASVDAASASDMEAASGRLKQHVPGVPVVVILNNADIRNTRAVFHAGAADVLPAPVSEGALALCLERLLARAVAEQETTRKPGRMVALLKGGGGAGATSIGAQAASLVSEKLGAGKVCFADLDVQFGAASLYFDLNDALTVTECLAAGDALSETQFANVLAQHASGTRLLAAPRDITELDRLTPSLAESLIGGLRRDFAVTILDLPPVWTAWTNRALHLSSGIVLITRLSVPHVHLARRQLKLLAMQKLDSIPLTLVCNAVTPGQQDLLSLKTAERALGRAFDIVIPEDQRLMGAASNQGVMLPQLRRGSKLEKAIETLANVIAADVAADAATATGR